MAYLADRARELADIIARHLAAPSPVGGEAIRFAETALGLSDANAWRELLAEADDPDCELLVETLLFPGDGLRRAVEPALSNRPWSAQLADTNGSDDVERLGAAGGADTNAPADVLMDVEALAMALAGRTVRFVLPDASTVAIPLDSEGAALLVRRLRLDNTPPETVLAALASLDDDRWLGACVRLRMARFPWSDAARFMVRTLAERLGTDTDFPRLLDWCCLFLEAEDTASEDSSARQDQETLQPETCGRASGIGASGPSPAAEAASGGSVHDGLIQQPDFPPLPDLPGLPARHSVTPPAYERLSVALAHRHALAVRLLKDHIARQQRWDASNFETMLLSGDRPPNGDPDALRSDMVSADRIRLAVFGLSAASSVLDRDFGTVDSVGDVSDMFRLLD